MINNTIISRFIKLAANKIGGEWVLIGGSVLSFLKILNRSTLDIDIVGPQSSTQADQLVLMEIAEHLEIPVESINQAASFFYYRLKPCKKDLLLLHQGTSARIYRPNATFYVLLKLARFTETDLGDCKSILSYAKNSGEDIDKKKLLQTLSYMSGHSKNPSMKGRLKELEIFTKNL